MPWLNTGNSYIAFVLQIYNLASSIIVPHCSYTFNVFTMLYIIVVHYVFVFVMVMLLMLTTALLL